MASARSKESVADVSVTRAPFRKRAIRLAISRGRGAQICDEHREAVVQFLRGAIARLRLIMRGSHQKLLRCG